jgi:hypothetical protein
MLRPHAIAGVILLAALSDANAIDFNGCSRLTAGAAAGMSRPTPKEVFEFYRRIGKVMASGKATIYWGVKQP